MVYKLPTKKQILEFKKMAKFSNKHCKQGNALVNNTFFKLIYTMN